MVALTPLASPQGRRVFRYTVTMLPRRSLLLTVASVTAALSAAAGAAGAGLSANPAATAPATPPPVLTVAASKPVPRTGSPAPFTPAVYTPQAPEVELSLCAPTARACVDLDAELAWLITRDGTDPVPVPIGQGAPGFETPRGTFHVVRKVRHDVSYAYDLAPMPYSVYFTLAGHAFHEGDTSGQSHGCVRLDPGTAADFYTSLEPGDEIHIF